MIKYVLFDMDGVLIDAREWHYEALNRALALFGYKISRNDHLEMYDGLPTVTKLKMLTREKALPVALHGFVNKMKQKYTMEAVLRQCRPVFRHQYALSRLKAEGVHIAVCSNSIRRSIEVMLQYADLDRFIDFYLSNEDVRQAKPNPEIYQAAMARFAARPDECLVVEDNPIGIKAAEASGAHVLRVSGPEAVSYDNIRAAIDDAAAAAGAAA
jgi:beta-phosphoglucomutase-like phosphatase (HAD superfamily)